MTAVVDRNNVRFFGKGEQTLLFAHGFGCDQNMWRYLVPSFGNNFQIVLFDYVGCGKSDITCYSKEKYSYLDGYAQDVIDVCTELKLNNVIFIGHSVSAMIGVLAIIKEPSIFTSMVFIAPSPCYINEQDYHGGFERKDLSDLLELMENNYLGWAGFLAPVVMKNDERPELSQELAESFCSTDPGITKQFARTTFFSDNRNDLFKVDVPVLILQCSEDSIAPGFVGEYIANRISGSTLVKMKATGHCPHMSHPAETIQSIQNFLSEQHHNKLHQ